MSLINELKRRNVFKVAIAYIVMAWLVMQVADVILNNIEAPGWMFKVILLLLGIGFLFAMFFAWAFELTPEGLRREHEVDRTKSITHQTSRKLDFMIMGAMAVALGYLTYDRFTLSTEREVALVEAEIQGAADAATNQVDAAALSNKSIAVLPFDNRSADEENAEFFAAGVHDELLTSLSKLGELRVISRTSVESLDANLSIPEIGALLNVATVLEGQVQRAGDQVRINVQLIDAGTDEHLWAEIYDRKLTATNIFLIQSEIATSIAAALRSKLTPQEQKQLEVIPTENLAALEAYFLGKQSMAKRTRVALVQAVSYFKRAIELDPGFALAYIGQAIAIIAQTDNTGLPPQEAFAVAEPLIRKALGLDDQSGEAYAALGMIYGYIGDREAAESAFRRALELSPNYVGAHHGYSMFLREFGYYDAGLKHINEAIRLDPLSAVVQVNLGTVLFELGRPGDALIQFKKVVALDPAYPPGHWSVGALYWTGFGQLDKALMWLKQAVKKNPGDAITPAWLGLLYLDLGDETEAGNWINKALELGPESPIPNWAMEMLLVYQGENAQAKEYANKVLQQNPSWALSLADLRNQDLQAGRVVDAGARYEEQFPALFNDDDPMIDSSNVQAAINLSLIVTRLGQPARATFLLDRSLDYAESTTIPRLHWYPFAYGIPQQVQIYALKGKTQKSLEALRQAVDDGWRGLWWYWLKHDPNLDSIRHEPEFQAMVEEIRADMAAQLERVRAMEAEGDLESIPGIN